jgi:hypothetical protein
MEYHGFIKNAWDTKVMSSYVDENYSNGLKQNSKRYLDYDQTSYAEVTQRTGVAKDLPKGGRVIRTETVKDEDDNDVIMTTKEYRMNELTAREVFDYGCDDTICTSALFNFYAMQMELEDTIDVFEQVEVKPAYLTAQSYVHGTKVSIQRMKEFEKEDDATFEKSRSIFSKALVENGLVEQMWEPYTECRCTDFKEGFELLYGYKIESKVRTHSKLAAQMRSDPALKDDPASMRFASAVEREDIAFVNALLLAKYRNDPVIDMGSPKEMKKFLYDVLGLPVRVISKPTPLEKKDKPELAETLFRFTKAAMKGETVEWTPEERLHLRAKAKTDDVAIGMALMYDATGLQKTILNALTDMKTIITRRSFYYNKYPYMKHWKDGMIHSNINQSAAVTRRYSSSSPNLQQLPKKGEGVKIRQMIVPHHKDAVVVSLDFKGQELILAANESKDPNMVSCYVGDNKRDIHSITASGAMEMKWGKKKLDELIATIDWKTEVLTADDKYDLFVALHKQTTHPDIHKLADDLRKNAKNVNFGAQYDSQALTLSYTILIPVADAQGFLDAREAMFPLVSVWKDEVRESVMRLGFATTLMGARRHLAKLMFDRETSNKASRQGPNFVIQGSAAEQTKLAMARVWDSNVTYDYDCRMIAPIHDELVFSVHRDHAVECIRIIHAAMVAKYANMFIPSMSSISLGPDFGRQIECGDEFIEKNIKAALSEVFKVKEAA